MCRIYDLNVAIVVYAKTCEKIHRAKTEISYAFNLQDMCMPPGQQFHAKNLQLSLG